MKHVHTLLRFLFGLLLLMPAVGSFGFLPEPTADMYSSTEAWDFISALATTPYMMPLIGITCFIASLLYFANRTALATIIITPFTVNVLAFHLFFDSPIVNTTAIPAYILVALTGYFLYANWNKYTVLFTKG